MLTNQAETYQENHHDILEAKILQKRARIFVLGMGYVGLPLALSFAETGFPVFGLDLDKARVDDINRGISYIPDVSFDSPRAKTFRASTDFALLRKSDIVIVCVPTPLSKTRDPDLSMVMQAAQAVAETLHEWQLIVLESTTYPGTTRELLPPLMERHGLKVGEEFFLAYSPERIDPGNQKFTFANTPKVVAGITPACSTLVQALYGQVVREVVPVDNTDTAEMVKLLENTFRSVNIALVNEFAIMSDRLGLDVWEVIRAASTKPFGFLP